MNFMMYFMYFFLYTFRTVLSFHEVYMEYYFIDLKLNWFDAQQYCRENYTDLVTVSTMEDLRRLKTPSTYTGDTWIGLYDDPASWRGVMGNDSNSWRWSVTGSTSPGGYQNWKSDEPNNYKSINNCVHITYGLWADAFCGHKIPFVCFTGSKEFTFVSTTMSWTDAQSYCRQHYTDLAMMEDETENAAVASLSPGTHAWIGLYREPWRWSDGSTGTFTNWETTQPDNENFSQHCVKLNSFNKWYDAFCTQQFAFHCEKVTERKLSYLIKIKLQTAVDLSDASISTLKQIQAHLMNMGLTDLNLKWKILAKNLHDNK